MKFSVLLVTLGLGATLSSVLAQPANPVLGGTRIVNDTFSFSINGADPIRCVVQIGTNNGGNISWQDVGPANTMFFSGVVKDGQPRHFRVRCDVGPTFYYSVNAASYCWIQPPPGFSMLSYPLESDNNTVSNLLPSASEGTLLHSHNPAVAQFETAQFQFGRWSNPELRIPRGKAAMLWSPPGASALPLHGLFSGGNATNRTFLGFNLLAPWWPVDSPVPSEPLCDGRIALELIGTDGIDPIYRAYTEIGLTWYDDQFNERPPPFRPFSGLWLQGCNHIWTQTRVFPAKNGGTESMAKGGSPAGVYFNNYVPGFGIDARLVHPGGEVPAGSNWLAQLYAGDPGTSENNLIAATGDPLPFLSGDLAGYLDARTGAARILIDVPPDSNAVAQIRFWDARTGASYDAATVKASSPMFLVPTRVPAVTPPVPLLGLMSPRLGISRQMLPTTARLTVEGYRGMSYQIEASSTLSNWTAVGTVTNTTPISTFTKSGVQTNRQEFYRASILKPVP